MLILFFSLFSAFANDPLAIISDRGIRETLTKAQGDEIIRRQRLVGVEC